MSEATNARGQGAVERMIWRKGAMGPDSDVEHLVRESFDAGT